MSWSGTLQPPVFHLILEPMPRPTFGDSHRDIRAGHSGTPTVSAAKTHGRRLPRGQVLEDLVDDRRVLDACQHLDLAPALRGEVASSVASDPLRPKSA